MMKMNRALPVHLQLSYLRNVYRKLIEWLLIGGTMLLTACASSSVVSISSIYQSQQCAIDEAQLIFLENLEQLYSFMESVRRLNLNAGKTAIVPPTTDGRAIVVAMGNRPNSGYRLELTDSDAWIDGKTLKLPLSFIEPREEQMSAQVVTSPCIVIAVNTREGYQQVQAGDLLAETP